MVAYRRAVKRLDEQGYVKQWHRRRDHSLCRARDWGGDCLTLTPKGRRQARALLRAMT
jgi:Mn-dependent DtxR family transcriptional regulator